MGRLITITGAFKNAGDHLIGNRARQLLTANTDHEVIDLNRRLITDDSYALMNKAAAVLLTGGPAYQQAIFPNVYDLDLSRIEVPVVAYGLGWKGKLGQAPEDFRFTPEAEHFVKGIHSNGLISSARDNLTVQMLGASGVNNVLMTGCPAWYNELKITTDFESKPIESLVFSMPAVIQDSTLPVLKFLSRKFPKAKKYLAFNAGEVSTRSKNAAEITKWNKKISFRAKLLGFEAVSYESNFQKFVQIQSGVDLHVGFRVHSHIFSLSERIASVLIAEDSRGVGQLQAMGSTVLIGEDSAEKIIGTIEELISNEGQAIQSGIEKMRATHPKMLEFISQFS